MNCSKCGLPGKTPTDFLQHRHCQHYTHVECLDPDISKINYRQCGRCTGDYDDLQMAAADLAASTGLEFKEPCPTDGIDYVMQPGRERQSAGVGGFISSYWNKGKTQEVDGWSKLNSKVSIDELMKTHGLGLQHLLKQGVKLDQFLVNDYTLDDLLKFKDIGQKGSRRAELTLIGALQGTADHLRFYPHALPMEKLKQVLDVKTNAEVCSKFGLRFPPDEKNAIAAPLTCPGCVYQWTAKDCVLLGLDMNDLMGLGMKWLQQYEDLFIPEITDAEAQKLETQLKVTKPQIDRLWVPEKPPTPPLPKKQIETRVEEEEPPYEEEEEVSYEKPKIKPIAVIHPRPVSKPASAIPILQEDKKFSQRMRRYKLK